MHEARAFAFRQRATQAYQKAMRPNISDETRRAWLIIEREWIKMAEREEAKLNDHAGGIARRQLSDQRSRQAQASWEELEAAVDAIKWDKDRP